MILKSEYEINEEIPLQDLPSLLSESMRQFSDRVCMIDSITGKEYTYGYSYECCRKIAQTLYRTYGLRKGDIGLLCSANCPEYLLFAFGAASIGVILTMINPLYKTDEILYYLNEVKPKIILTSQEQCTKVKQASKIHGKIQDIFVLGTASGCISYTSLLDNDGMDLPEVVFDPKNDVFVMPFSSGTTGKPKGVMLSHWNMIANNRQVKAPGFEFLSRNTRDVVLIYLPLYHMYGFALAKDSFLGGHTTVIMPKYDLHLFVHIIKKYKVTVLCVVPPTVLQLTKYSYVCPGSFDSVRQIFYGAAPLGSELENEFSQKFTKQELRQAYASTETTAYLIRVPTGQPLRPGAAGKLLPLSEARFVDPETGKDVGMNERGELWVRGPQVMKGYWNRSKETEDAIDTDGFYHTGDVAYYDKDGYIYIVDRLKELLKYNAFQVSPAEIEGLILSHDAVADCAVVGVPDAASGELPRAYIVLKDGHRATEEEIVHFVSRLVAPHKKIRGGVRFVQTIPKSPSGKILRRIIKAQARHELNSKM